jgi:hypothetical protein
LGGLDGLHVADVHTIGRLECGRSISAYSYIRTYPSRRGRRKEVSCKR